MGALATLRFIWQHPLASRRRAHALERYVRWQLGSRLSPGPVVVDFVNDARLLVRPGMTGATGNVYAGLHELEDMAFVLHALRPSDTFLDVGANVGSYTVIAAKGVGARCVTFEPVPSSLASLRDNVLLNGVSERVELHNQAVGGAPGTARITITHDTGNRITTRADASEGTAEVEVVTLDSIASASDACILKIDVEGFESEVLKGAQRLLQSPKLLAVIMETNRSASGQGGSDTAAHEAMLAAGFSPFTYAPFERRLISLGRGYKQDANTIYVRDLARASERVRTAPPFEALGLKV